MTAGRPSLKTEALVAEIVERLSCGEPMAKICKDDHMPAFSTVWRWEAQEAVFAPNAVRRCYDRSSRSRMA